METRLALGLGLGLGLELGLVRAHRDEVAPVAVVVEAARLRISKLVNR